MEVLMRKWIGAWLVFRMICNGMAMMPSIALASDFQIEQAFEEEEGLAVYSAGVNRYAKVATQKGTLNMRAQAKDNAKILARLPKGTIVCIVEDGGEWTEILYKGRAGYVKASFLTEIAELPYSLITKEETGDTVLAFKRKLYKLGYLKADDVNTRFDAAMVTALTKAQLMNGVALNPEAIVPELQALMDWGMITKYKSGYLETATDKVSGLTVSIFCWDTGGTLYEEDKSVKVGISFAAQAAGGQPPYTVSVRKSLSARGGEQSGDVVTSPFSQIWSQNSDRLYIFATAVDAAGNSVTACAPFRFTMPARYMGE